MASKINLTSIIDSSTKIGKNVEIGHFVTIGKNVIIGDDARIEHGAIIYEDCKIGAHSTIAPNAVLRPKTIIGQSTIFGSSSVSEGNNQIGNCTTIHAQCHITSNVIIGDHCFIAPFFIASNTKRISSGTHGTAKKKRGEQLTTVIEDYVRIGICVSMTPGNKIGHHSEIYQNCLITKDIPPNSIVKAGKDQVGRVIGQHAQSL